MLFELKLNVEKLLTFNTLKKNDRIRDSKSYSLKILQQVILQSK